MPNHYAAWNVAGCPNMQLYEGYKPQELMSPGERIRMKLRRFLYVACCCPVLYYACLCSIPMIYLALALAWCCSLGPCLFLLYVPFAKARACLRRETLSTGEDSSCALAFSITCLPVLCFSGIGSD